MVQERCLKKIDIVVKDNEDLFGGLNELKDIELWNSKSKIVNEHIRSISRPLKFISLVNPIHTPIWAIVDKPYNIYSANNDTLLTFTKILNYSNVDDNIANNAILAGISEKLFLMFYIEVIEGTVGVKCLVLDIDFSKIDEVLSRDDNRTSDSQSYFIDELATKKDEMIDSLLRQRSSKAISTKMKKQESEKFAQDQQLRIVNTRQNFRRVINREIKKKMASYPKSTQVEIGDICFKSMTFKFKDMKSFEENDENEVRSWLNVFLKVLGV